MKRNLVARNLSVQEILDNRDYSYREADPYATKKKVKSIL